MDVEQIAHVAHEANRAYCASIGDTSQAPWTDAPEWQRQSAIKGAEFHIATLADGREPTPSASHDCWLAEKERDGWKYGPVKDPDKKEHPCFVPYDELPMEQRLKDYIFSGIVKAFYDGVKGLSILILLAAPLAAQVDVICTPSPLEYSRAVLDKKTAPNLQHWACVVTNMDLDPATIQEAAVQAWMMRQGVAARSSRTIRLGVGEIQRKRWPATAGRVLPFGASVMTGLIAMDQVNVSNGWAAGIAFGALLLPQIGQRLASREVDPAVFEQIVMQGDALLAPGQSLEIAMFAAPLAQPPVKIEGELPMPGVALRDIGTFSAPTTADIWRAAIYGGGGD